MMTPRVVSDFVSSEPFFKFISIENPCCCQFVDGPEDSAARQAFARKPGLQIGESERRFGGFEGFADCYSGTGGPESGQPQALSDGGSCVISTLVHVRNCMWDSGGSNLHQRADIQSELDGNFEGQTNQDEFS